MAAEGDWSFMRPWCQHLHDRLYYAGESPLTSPDEILYYLAVGLPTIRPWSDDLETIMDSTRKLREAVALLTAVAHVDHATWKRLLLDDCHMDVGTEEDVFMGDIPPRFQLTLDCDGPDSGDVIPHGLLAFCGTEQHANHTEEYSEALAKIATLSHDSGSAAATEIEIPITVEISPWLTESSEGTFMYAQSIHQVIRTLRAHWQHYCGSGETGLSLTFVLEAIKMDLKVTRGFGSRWHPDLRVVVRAGTSLPANIK